MRPAFRSLLDFLNRKALQRDENNQPIAPLPLELTTAQCRQLEDLVRLPEWDVFLLCLDRQSTLYGEGMLAATDRDDMVRAQGMILGLRKAGILLTEVLQGYTNKKDEDERRRSNAEHERNARNASLYASPAWTVLKRATNGGR